MLCEQSKTSMVLRQCVCFVNTSYWDWMKKSHRKNENRQRPMLHASPLNATELGSRIVCWFPRVVFVRTTRQKTGTLPGSRLVAHAHDILLVALIIPTAIIPPIRTTIASIDCKSITNQWHTWKNTDVYKTLLQNQLSMNLRTFSLLSLNFSL